MIPGVAAAAAVCRPVIFASRSQFRVKHPGREERERERERESGRVKEERNEDVGEDRGGFDGEER